MPKLHQASFLQLLLLAFLLIAGLLAAASLRSLYTLEQLVTRTRGAADLTVQLSAAAAHLSDRTVVMERASRQYIVLEDPVLLKRFNEAAKEASRTLNQPLEQHLPAQLSQQWPQQLNEIRTSLSSPKSQPSEQDKVIGEQYRVLAQTNAAITEAIRVGGERRSLALQAQLESSRTALKRQVVGTILLSITLALVFALWLTRPLKQMEKAITGLGGNLLDQPVEVQGPRDLRSLGTKLEWLRLRLKELDDDKSRFLRHVSHELKTPLAALREAISLLEEGVAGELNANQREISRILNHNVIKLQGQIEVLLRFNAAAFDARRLKRQPTELKTLLLELIDAQQLQWQSKQLQLRVDGEPSSIEADTEKLTVAIGNLVSNAIRFSPVGGAIDLRISHVPGWVHLDVIDQGVGVSDKDASRVFEPFFRGERQPDGLIKGTGIGLSIVREYIQAHGGRVDLLGPGPGAHFRVELPYVES